MFKVNNKDTRTTPGVQAGEIPSLNGPTKPQPIEFKYVIENQLGRERSTLIYVNAI